MSGLQKRYHLSEKNEAVGHGMGGGEPKGGWKEDAHNGTGGVTAKTERTVTTIKSCCWGSTVSGFSGPGRGGQKIMGGWLWGGGCGWVGLGVGVGGVGGGGVWGVGF